MFEMSDSDARDNRYELLAIELLYGDDLPDTVSRGYRGSVYLTEADDQRLCNIVCERVYGMSMAVWHEASNERRIPMLEAALERGGPGPVCRDPAPVLRAHDEPEHD